MGVKWNKCRHLGDKTGARFPPGQGLGDWIDSALTAVGMTKTRWDKLVSRYQKDEGGNCHSCDKRHTFANWLGRFVGLPEGRGPELNDALKIIETPEQPIYHCQVHGCCIGTGELPGTVQQTAGLQPCQTCPDFEKE